MRTAQLPCCRAWSCSFSHGWLASSRLFMCWASVWCTMVAAGIPCCGLMYHGDDFPQLRRLLVLGSGAGGHRGVGFLIFFDGAWEFTSGVLTRRSLFSRYPSRPVWSLRGLLTRLAWARCSRGIRHARHGLVTVFSHTFAWARCSRGIRHTRRGLIAVFSHTFAWACCSHGIRHARHGLVAVFSHAFAWARCSPGIRHAWHGLVAVFSHALRGLVVLAVSVMPGVVSSWFSHTPCLGS